MKLLKEIEKTYSNITIDEGIPYLRAVPCQEMVGVTTWTVPQLESVQAALGIIRGGLDYLRGDFSSLVGRLTIKHMNDNGASTVPMRGQMRLTNMWSNDPNGWSRVNVVIHEMGHIITYNQPLTMSYFMTELGAFCKDEAYDNVGLRYCQNQVKALPYDPGKYNIPSAYATTVNREDYAETFLTIIVEEYVASGNQTFINDAAFLKNNNGKNHDIPERRRVMLEILDGAWKLRWNK